MIKMFLEYSTGARNPFPPLPKNPAYSPRFSSVASYWQCPSVWAPRAHAFPALNTKAHNE